MAGRKVTDGKSVRVTVPQNTTVNQGDFVLLDGFFGMAVQTVVTGAGVTKPLILNTEECTYETNQITVAEAFTKGTPVYWNDTTKLLTITVGTNRLVGRVELAKDGNNVIFMKLGPQV